VDCAHAARRITEGLIPVDTPAAARRRGGCKPRQARPLPGYASLLRGTPGAAPRDIEQDLPEPRVVDPPVVPHSSEAVAALRQQPPPLRIRRQGQQTLPQRARLRRADYRAYPVLPRMANDRRVRGTERKDTPAGRKVVSPLARRRGLRNHVVP